MGIWITVSRWDISIRDINNVNGFSYGKNIVVMERIRVNEDNIRLIVSKVSSLGCTQFRCRKGLCSVICVNGRTFFLIKWPIIPYPK